MMATTHALTGVAIAAAAALVSPEVSVVAVGAAAAGGFFPDLDLYAGHRKTLHFPVYFSVAALLAVGIAAFDPTTLTVAGALFLVAAAVHSVMDAFGGGLELRPWLGTSDRAVYSHFHDRWIPPRRWIRYDGSPEDLGLASLMAAPALVTFDGPVTLGIIALVAISAVYVLLRKPMVTIAEWLVARLPTQVRMHVPARFVEDLQ
ncbi:MAG: metal-dependent hydrolase [Halanaeroarchaeum sp.]